MQEQTFKPTLNKYFKIGGGYVRIVIGVIIIILIAVFGYDRPVFWAAPLSVATLLIVLVGFHARRLTVSDQGIKYSGWFGLKSRVTPETIGQIVFANNYYEYNFGGVKRILVGTPDGKRHFTLSTAYWTDEAYEALAAYAEKHNVKTVQDDDPTDFQTLVAKYGKMLPYFERHIFLTALYIVGGFIVGYLLYFVIFELPKY